MIRRGVQAAFYRYDFPKRRRPRRTRSRGDLPRDFPFGECVSAAKSARKTDDFPKRLLSPDGTRAGDDRVPTHRMLRAALKPPPSWWRAGKSVPTHRMLRAALKQNRFSPSRIAMFVPTHRMLRAAWDNKKHLSYKGRCFLYAEIIVSAAPSPDRRAGRRCRRGRRR